MNNSFESELKAYINSKGIKVEECKIGKFWWSSSVAVAAIEGFFSYSLMLYVKVETLKFVSVKVLDCAKKEIKDKIEEGCEVLNTEAPMRSFCEKYNHSWKDLFVELELEVKEFYSRLKNEQIPKATWLRANRNFYTHDGLYIGKNLNTEKHEVIHIYNSEANDSYKCKLAAKKESKALKDSIERLVADSKSIIIRLPILKTRHNDFIIKEAHIAVKEERYKGSYNLAENNCQHFCAELLGVEPYSPSVERVKDGAKTVGYALLASTVAGILITALTNNKDKKEEGKSQKETTYFPASDNYIRIVNSKSTPK